LMEAGRPLVLHNGFLDLLFAYHRFEEPLPETLAEFQSGLQKTIVAGTKVFDTKWMATYTSVGQKLGRQTGLEALVNSLDRQPQGDVPRIEFSAGFDRFSGPNKAFHDAAFDAYCTGRLFAYFCRSDRVWESAAASVPSKALGRPASDYEDEAQAAQRAKPAASAKAAGGPNRFLSLADESEDDSGEEVAGAQTTAAAASGDGKQLEQSDMLDPPSVADAGNRVFLMNSIWDFAWCSPGAPPISFVASERCVAIRFVFGLRHGVTSPAVTGALQEAWRQASAKDPWAELDVRWCGKGTASVFLEVNPNRRRDGDRSRLEEALEAVLCSAVTAWACSRDQGSPAESGRQQPAAFQWSADRARAMDAAMYS